jgi:hypothetical protein
MSTDSTRWRRLDVAGHDAATETAQCRVVP